MADVLKFPERNPPPKPLTPLRSVVDVALLHRCEIDLHVSPYCAGLPKPGVNEMTYTVLTLDPSQSPDRYASHTTDENGMRLYLAFGGNESVVVVPWSDLKAVMVRGA